MDRIIEVKVCGSHLTKDSNIAGTKGEGNITKLRITFDENWEDFSKQIIFWDAYGQNPVRIVFTVQMIEDITKSTRVYLVPIPHEAMTRAGWLTFSIKGSLDNKNQVSVQSTLEVKDSPDILDPIAPTPSPTEQLQAEIEAIKYDIRNFETAHRESTESAKVAKESADKALSTVGKSSYIGDNGYWYVWDEEKGEFCDTGVKAQAGSMVYTGSNPIEGADVWIDPNDNNALYLKNENGEFIPIPSISGKDGKSAYEQAQEGGYTGTEDEFIAMLNGITATVDGNHFSNFNNPHNVTAKQVGAIPEGYYLSTDLDIEMKQGGGKMTVCYYTSSTLNTPKAEGLTDYAHGMVITNSYTNQYGSQLCIPSGSYNMFLRSYNKQGITKWMKISPDDIKIIAEHSDALKEVLSKSGGTITGALTIDKPEAWAQLILRSPSDYYRALETSDDVLRIDVRDDQLASKRRYFEIYTNTAESKLSHAIRMAQTVDGVSQAVYMLHTANINNFVISGGSYTGSNSGLEKEIPIRKTTQALIIMGDNQGPKPYIVSVLIRGMNAAHSDIGHNNNMSSTRLQVTWKEGFVSFKNADETSTNPWDIVDITYRYVLIG